MTFTLCRFLSSWSLAFFTLMSFTPLAPALTPQDITWIPHDQVGLLDAHADENQLQFLPLIVFAKGTCFPASAIDSQGRLGAGLKASGKMNGNCLAFDKANIYTQSLNFGTVDAHLYALYFPKDGANPNSAGGHRHDWEHVIVWTDHEEITQVTFFQHSGWYTMPSKHVKKLDQRAVVYIGKAKHGFYHSRNNGPNGFIEGLCYFCDTREDNGLVWDAPHRLVAFESLEPLQKELLQATLWDHANSPFRPDVFAAQAQAILGGELCRDRGCQCNIDQGSCPGFP